MNTNIRYSICYRAEQLSLESALGFVFYAKVIENVAWLKCQM